MDKLTDEQKQRLIKRMKTFEDDTFDTHAMWATTTFGVPINKDECSKLFMESMFAFI